MSLCFITVNILSVFRVVPKLGKVFIKFFHIWVLRLVRIFHGLASGSVYFKLGFSSILWMPQDTFTSWHSLWSQSFMSQHITCHMWIGTMGVSSFPGGDFHTEWLAITQLYIEETASHITINPSYVNPQLTLSQVPRAALTVRDGEIVQKSERKDSSLNSF